METYGGREMDDNAIVALFFSRTEAAISETQKKYGRYCHRIAKNVLENDDDADECVNDAYLKLWNSIPPSRPDNLQAFIGKITRNLALDLYTKLNAGKRTNNRCATAIEELSECLSDDASGDFTDELALSELLSSFLRTLPEKQRNIFIRRYWHMETVKSIARTYDITEANVNVILHRTRDLLKHYLESEGVNV